jgi:serine/threonine protein kinase
VDGRVGLPKGTLLDGSYRIERVIGPGGFGITYEAEDVKLGTKVAIKEYYPEEFGYRGASLSVRPKSEQHTKTFEWGRSRFLQEASTLARFRHPSVVQVTRVFEAFSTAYMVMVFERGQSFEGWLKHLGRQPTQEELDRIAGPILDALEMMHGESFLHRDIAPDNIIVRADGTPVLLDFGAARRAVAEESRSLTGVVKSGYSPQEQYATDGRMQGPWTDIYAFGATLYRAVTGKAPEESTLRAIDDRMLSAVNVGDGKYRPGFLEAIDACLEVHHADRPQSVAQVRSMLLTRPAGEISPLAPVVAALRIEMRKMGTIGDVLRAQGDLPEALEAYRASLAIAEQLAKTDPGNAGWQRDLSVSHEKVGDVLRAQSDLPGALEAYRASLAIAEQLAKTDPGNAGWQRDVALAQGRVAMVIARQDTRELAKKSFEQGSAIIARLKPVSPDTKPTRVPPTPRKKQTRTLQKKLLRSESTGKQRQNVSRKEHNLPSRLHRGPSALNSSVARKKPSARPTLKQL